MKLDFSISRSNKYCNNTVHFINFFSRDSLYYGHSGHSGHSGV